MKTKMDLKPGEVFVEGRSQAKARELLQNAKDAGVDSRLVRSASTGYIVPEEVRDGKKTPKQDNVLPTIAEETDTSLPHPDSPADEERKAQQFDPSDHGIGKVKAYLEGADEEERQRVLDAERNGKARKSLLPDDEREED